MSGKTFVLIVPFINDGGVEKLVANLANYIRAEERAGVKDVFVYAMSSGNQLGRKFFRNSEGLFLTFGQLLAVCAQRKKEIILFSALTPANGFAFLLSLVFGLQYFPSHNCVVYNTNPLRWAILKMSYRLFYWRASRFVAVSEGVRHNLADIVGDSRKIPIWYTPVFDSLLRPQVKRELHPQERPVHFCVLGRLSHQKGFDIAVRAFGALRREGYSNFLLTVAGSGEELGALERLVEDNGLQKHVRFQGFVIDLPEFYSDKDYYLFPSRFEGLGLALIEAMNCGLPVIASDCDYGPSEILYGGKLGSLISSPEDIAAWTDAIRSILATETIVLDIDYTESLNRFLSSTYLSGFLEVSSLFEQRGMTHV